MKEDIKDLDKKLVTENKLIFSDNNNIQMLLLSEDGNVKKYINGKYESSFSFSKTGLIKESKNIIQEGYFIVEDINNQEEEQEKQKILQNPEQTKQDLQQGIKDAEEIQSLQKQLDDKVNEIVGESKEEDTFPSTEFTSKTILEDEVTVDNFNKNLTPEQKTYIVMSIGTVEEVVNSLKALFKEFEDIGFMKLKTSIDEYIAELKVGTSKLNESKDTNVNVEQLFNDFIKGAKEKAENNTYAFRLKDLDLTSLEATEFKNLLLQSDEIEDVKYNNTNNSYIITFKDNKDNKDNIDNIEQKDNIEIPNANIKEVEQPILEKKEEKASIDWNNYLTKQEVEKITNSSSKRKAIKEVIYSDEFTPRFKDLHNDLQKKYNNSWSKPELVKDLNTFIKFGHLITESKTEENTSSKLILYHYTRDNETALKIAKEGIRGGLRLNAYGKDNEAEGSGVWCSIEKMTFDKPNIVFQIDSNDKSIWKANDTQYIIYRDIRLEEIIDIDLIVIDDNKGTVYSEDYILNLIEEYKAHPYEDNKYSTVEEEFMYNLKTSHLDKYIIAPYNIEQLKHLVETKEKYCQSKNILQEYYKWKPSNSQKREFAQKMQEIDEFCAENDIEQSLDSDS